MATLPETQTSIVGLEDGNVGISPGIPLPRLEDDMILVKTAAVGVNPVDTKMVGPLCTQGAVAGMDFAGDVVAVGPNAKASVPLAVGDRVCGAVQGMNPTGPRVGAFTHYVGATAHVLIKLPPNLTYEQGASLGSGLGTIGLALKKLDLPGLPYEPAQKPRHVLIYGGSSATGTLAIQLVKLAGFKPITTCSPRNFDLVKSYGAEEAFDYNAKDCAADIKAYTKNSLKYVLDCISEPETMQFCYQCIGRLGGRYVALEPFHPSLHTRANVHPDWVLGPTMIGKPISWRPPFERAADPEVLEYALRWYKIAQRLIDNGELKTHPLQVMDGGLGGVLEGMELLKAKKISGKKLVYLTGA
ncbi:uncharacterized protein E0L32_002373 [Thyridium curvatum]|uniref:Enoyl reductase (ER) domain-containing protein n=1 Tax=Thyridium curvatum TaxID=1093900 RepID=A0A507AJB3_9PEZI|nr:uncharacterized protein E0L32_002373 [Thyridium curvatum]TPX06877.1 hypothetical protein E0L32_002373 [Thyridium curvatum]